MKKSELKRILKPLVKECIKDVLLEEGLLSNIVSEVTRGLTSNMVVENKVQTPQVPDKEHMKLLEEKQELLKQQRRKIRRDAIHTKHNDSTPMDLPSPAWDHIYSNETREAWK